MTKIAEVAPDQEGDPEVQAKEANKDVNTGKETIRQMILVVQNPVQDRGIAEEIPETEIAIVLEIASVNVNENGKGVNEKENVGNVRDVIGKEGNGNAVNVNKNVGNGKDGSKNDETENEKSGNKNDENVNVKKSNFVDVKPPKRPDVVNRLNNVGNARNVMIQALMTMLMTKLKSREIRTERTGTRVSQKTVLTKIEAENQGTDILI